MPVAEGATGRTISYEETIQMADLNAIKEMLNELSLLEASQLVKMLESEWGVSAAAPVAMAAMPAAAAEAAPVEEQTEFDVVLTGAGDKKINVIKVVRALTNLGLKEAKDVVEGTPSTVLTAVSKEAAQDAKAKLEAEGAQVTVK
jgi:large subunit ribosomal protein L7/L12